MAYRDLRDYLEALEKRGKLHRVTAEVDKDWEIAAVCRRVFQKIIPERRPVLLFERVKGFRIPVLVGSLGASSEVYAVALQDRVENIHERWEQAQTCPIKPTRVPTGPCKEHVLRGNDADLSHLPVPIWTVGEDPGPYITAPCVVSRDPETQAYNVGTYRLQVKGPRKLGIQAHEGQHISHHRRKYEARSQNTPVAIVLGPDPTIEMASVTKFNLDTEEYDIAGGLRGEPVPLVPCETVPIEVPAPAEIVIEGEIPPGYRELEGPFGEYTGYMGASGNMPVIEVTCITHRDHPIYRAFFSQMPPSESSCIKQTGREQSLLKHLKVDLRLPVLDLHLPESAGVAGIMLISIKKGDPSDVKRVVSGAMRYAEGFGKFIVVFDEDIEIRDHFQVDWAMSFHVQPAKDIEIIPEVQAVALDPSQAPADVPQEHPSRRISSKVIIDATRKHTFPALSLPPKEHLRRVDAEWAKYGLE
ncbi:MAG: UbiD family decarboxylase [Deltaproteobacteria bacterium]|nr:UbiD family decarboxylase [Deltaproteobacteria bacterium]